MYLRFESEQLGINLYLEGVFFMPKLIGKTICYLKKNHVFQYTESCDRNCGFMYETQDNENDLAEGNT